MKSLIFVFLISSLSNSSLSQTGEVLDNIFVKSSILGMDRKFSVYLPPSYKTSTRSYPVLYLLHGAGDDQAGWIQFGEVLRITDKAIMEGTATEMIIVMPDAKTTQIGYINRADRPWRFEDFFFEEFIPQVEKKFRIRAEKQSRAVAGLSLGGFAAYLYALHHPEMFSAACPLSAVVALGSLDDLKAWSKNENWRFTGSSVEAYYNKHTVLELIKNTSNDHRKSLRWYIDCGDDDWLSEGNTQVHVAMKKAHISHEFRIRDGGHNWTYWRSALASLLTFVSEGFHQ